MKSTSSFLRLVLCVLASWMAHLPAARTATTTATATAEPRPPNILFIAIDDLNDWIGCLGGHPL